jgi:hypothetical protein
VSAATEPVLVAEPLPVHWPEAETAVVIPKIWLFPTTLQCPIVRSPRGVPPPEQSGVVYDVTPVSAHVTLAGVPQPQLPSAQPRVSRTPE